jgi:hypothetical protein
MDAPVRKSAKIFIVVGPSGTAVLILGWVCEQKRDTSENGTALSRWLPKGESRGEKGRYIHKWSET